MEARYMIELLQLVILIEQARFSIEKFRAVKRFFTKKTPRQTCEIVNNILMEVYTDINLNVVENLSNIREVLTQIFQTHDIIISFDQRDVFCILVQLYMMLQHNSAKIIYKQKVFLKKNFCDIDLAITTSLSRMSHIKKLLTEDNRRAIIITLKNNSDNLTTVTESVSIVSRCKGI